MPPPSKPWYVPSLWPRWSLRTKARNTSITSRCTWTRRAARRARLIGHVARANALWPLLPQQAVAVFHGPQAYVSPSWYPSKALDGKQVPTWNYATVHAHGALSAFDDPARLRGILHTLSEQHEAHRPDPWRIDDAPPDYIDKLLRAIVGIELAVERWEGIWKVSQNRTDTDRAGVVQGLMAEGTSAAEDMAALVLGRLMA